MEWPFASGKAQQRLRRQAEMCVRLFPVAEIKDPDKKQLRGRSLLWFTVPEGESLSCWGQGSR